MWYIKYSEQFGISEILVQQPELSLIKLLFVIELFS